jgi:hypothetical protein
MPRATRPMVIPPMVIPARTQNVAIDQSVFIDAVNPSDWEKGKGNNSFAHLPPVQCGPAGQARGGRWTSSESLPAVRPDATRAAIFAWRRPAVIQGKNHPSLLSTALPKAVYPMVIPVTRW